MIAMPTDLNIYSELMIEVQRCLRRLRLDVQYNWLAVWPRRLPGQCLPGTLCLLRRACE